MTLAYFPSSYTASRTRFRQSLEAVRLRWPDARLERFTIDPDLDLSIDWISTGNNAGGRQVLIFTTGEHGIEGYTGSAILQLFQNEFLGMLDPRQTSLLLVHSINPWGMHTWRRVNRNNVDLNRNFLAGAPAFDPAWNPDYRRMNDLLNPSGRIHHPLPAGLVFATKLLAAQAQYGVHRFKDGVLKGQYHTHQGIYYGGNELQSETRMMMELFEHHTQGRQQVLHLDMHTGYGPRYQMSLVNSALEDRPSPEFVRRFGYPLVVKANASEFYTIQGDMVDWIYQHLRQQSPASRVFATAFEFGTFGDSVPAALRSLRATIDENRLHHHGAASDAVRRQVLAEFRELFFPSEARWREKALSDARQALRGILKAEEYIR